MIALWQQVEEKWEDPKLHALFLETALCANAPLFAAQCYRAKGGDPTAVRQQERLVARLLASMSSDVPTRRRLRIGRAVALLILLLLLATALYLVYDATSRLAAGSTFP